MFASIFANFLKRLLSRGPLKTWAGTIILATTACFSATVYADPLRVCADPDNLPFSKSDGPERGMYVELAEMVGKYLNSPVEYTWWLTYFQRRALRNTLLEGNCDAIFALPAEGEYKARGVQRTRPFFAVSYALVAAPEFKFKSLEDLKSKRLGVQFLTTPHIVLSTLEGFSSTTFKSTDEVFEALGKGDIDAAFLWGPVAGYENKRKYANRWKVTPVTGHGFSGNVAVAVRSGKDALAADIDRALVALRGEIIILADKYGFPRDPPIDLSSATVPEPLLATAKQPSDAVLIPNQWIKAISDEPAAANAVKKAVAKKAPKKNGAVAKTAAAAATAGAVAASMAAPAPELSAEAKAGRVRFNDQCSHCHGTDGYSPVIERDLRRLKTRYDSKWLETALLAIREGRPSLGMPIWKDILKETDIKEVASFLTTIQR